MKLAKWIAIYASCAVLLFLVGAPTASADTITISTPDSALSGFTAPYATVTVNLIDSTDARITFTSDTTAGTSFLMGGHAAADLNLNPNFTVSGTITFATVSPGPGFNPVPFVTTYGTQNPTENIGGFGTFNFKIDLHGGYTDSASEIAFTLTNTSGTWASAADVLAANPDGNLAAIHGFACANPTGTGCSATAGAITTGFAANGPFTPPPPTPIPEPAGMTLMGMSVLAAYRALRRKA